MSPSPPFHPPSPPPSISNKPEEPWKDYPFIRFRWEIDQHPTPAHKITKRIGRYLQARSIAELYSYALEHLEELYGREPVQDVLGGLWRSQQSLTLQSIAALCQREIETVEQVIAAIGNHLLWHRESVRLSKTLRRVVAQRYGLADGAENTK